MSAKNAVLRRSSVYTTDDGSHRADGLSRIEVYSYLSATWRGQDVTVTVVSDRYAASYHDEANGTSESRLTPWRSYVHEARFGTYEESKRTLGDSVSGTARAALDKICTPLVAEWLDSKEYVVVAQFQTAIARMIVRHFNDPYNRIPEALAAFKDRLDPDHYRAISAALDAYNDFTDSLAVANAIIEGQPTAPVPNRCTANRSNTRRQVLLNIPHLGGLGASLLNFVVAFEEGDLTDKEFIDGFANLVRSGVCWQLQGMYGRTAMSLIEGGLIDQEGNVLRYPEGGVM